MFLRATLSCVVDPGLAVGTRISCPGDLSPRVDRRAGRVRRELRDAPELEDDELVEGTRYPLRPPLPSRDVSESEDDELAEGTLKLLPSLPSCAVADPRRVLAVFPMSIQIGTMVLRKR